MPSNSPQINIRQAKKRTMMDLATKLANKVQIRLIAWDVSHGMMWPLQRKLIVDCLDLTPGMYLEPTDCGQCRMNSFWTQRVFSYTSLLLPLYCWTPHTMHSRSASSSNSKTNTSKTLNDYVSIIYIECSMRRSCSCSLAPGWFPWQGRLRPSLSYG